MTLAVPIAFALATLASQRWLGGRKVQSAAAGVVIIHAATAAGLLLLVGMPSALELAASAIFWSGAALSWFVVRSHLESSILLDVLDAVVAGASDRRAVLDAFERTGGFAVRARELRAAGLVDDRQVPTARGVAVLALFDRIGAGSLTAGPGARRPSAL
jgi:hypothetical protein